MRSTTKIKSLAHAAASTVALFTALAGLGACSSDDEGAGSITAFGQQYSEVVCSGFASCCAETGQPVDKGQCQQLFQYQISEFEAGIGSGKYTYDAAAANECLAAVRALSNLCTEEPPEVCDRVTKGTVGANERCDDDAECAVPPGGGHATCNYSDEAEYGRCEQTLRGKVGDDCQQTCEDQAGSGWSCFGSGEDPVNGVGTACFRNDGLECDPGTKKCIALGAAGEACSFDDDCGQGLYCRSDLESSTCTALGAAGAACTSNSACESDYCDPSNVCAAPLAAGAVCDPNAERDPCGADGRCSEEGKCEENALFGGGGGAGFVCGFLGGG
jgi:hypothetical protein